LKPIGIIIFPGTQCEQDTAKACHFGKIPTQFIWYRDSFDYKSFSALILPGGFSYGDYLRAGALAARSPAVRNVIQANQKGYPILGICNGFQILCEAGLLPGALVQNTNLRFIDQWVELKFQNSSPFFAPNIKNCRLPIAHSEGRYIAHIKILEKLQDNNQIWLSYEKNPNGSVHNIAGILNKNKNTAGLMPHPERATEKWMGSTDGREFFKSWSTPWPP